MPKRDSLNTIIREFENVKTCALLTHINMDGDTLCSCLALKEFFKMRGVVADVLVEDEVPNNLKFLDGDIKTFVKEQNYPQYDLAIAVDCGSQDRLGEREEIFTTAKKSMVIDHHVSNKGFGDFCYVEPDASAVCEIIYKLFIIMEIPRIKYLSRLLFVGILTDTGGFRYSNTTPKTMRVAADLLTMGIDNALICSKVFDTKTLSELKIEALAVDKTEFYHQGKTAIAYITKELIDETGTSESEMSTLSSVLRSIEGVNTSAVLKDHNGALKVSMRSKDIVDVAEICAEIGGGGHARAAGATINDMSAEDVITFLTKRIGEAYERHN